MIIVMCYFILCLLALLYLGWRNNAVCEFRNRVNNLCYRWSIKHWQEESAYDWFDLERVSYDKMLYSFKPLKLDAWYPKENVKKLMQDYN